VISSVLQGTDGRIGVMRDELWEAATIAVIGVAMVMTALTILMLAIMVLTRLAPGKKESKVEATIEVAHRQIPGKESVAAIAVAMALAMEEEEKGSSHGGSQTVAPGHTVSRWSAAGRERLMGSRRRTEHKWGRRSE
jgi:Na+-transporting methylmalonyl-CoA/oxaloacetate decarboxylase gamma subunit